MDSMDIQDVQKKCEAFLAELGVPGFILFGWNKGDGTFGVVHSYRDAPPPAVVKGITWALNDFTQKTL